MTAELTARERSAPCQTGGWEHTGSPVYHHKLTKPYRAGSQPGQNTTGRARPLPDTLLDGCHPHSPSELSKEPLEEGVSLKKP